ncbi:MAG TPA: FHA domain-containing protein [Myxococcaceae bacterium]|nr:FHA domain-containing protein [Myxococcaceae bacterium]
MKLVIEDDEGNHQEIPVDGLDEITIGRAPGNTIQLDQRNVSRRHARLSSQSGALVVEDLHSANGTLLNGERLTVPRPLHDGDQLTIGDYGVVLQHDTDTHRIQVVEADVSDTAPRGISDTAPHPVAMLVAEVRPRLLVLTGRLQGTVLTVARTEVRLGKDPQAEISLPYRSLADFHCKLVQSSTGEWLVQGVGQAGVRVNGAPAADAPLRDGDLLELGRLQLRFVGPGDEVPEVPPTTRRRLPLLLLGILAAAAAAVVASRALEVRPPPPPAPAQPQAASPPREEPTLEVAPSTVPPSPPAAGSPPDPLTAVHAAMDARDYPRALQLLSQVKDPHRAAEVAALRKTARAEAAAGRAVALAQREMDAGRPGAALRQLKGAKGTRAWAVEAELLRARATEALHPKPSKKTAPRSAPLTSEALGLYQEGRRFYDADQLTEAVGWFVRCLERDPDFARCHLMLGTSYAKLNRMDDAERHYRRFLALAPADDPAVPRVKKILEDSENQKKATGQVPPH